MIGMDVPFLGRLGTATLNFLEPDELPVYDHVIVRRASFSMWGLNHIYGRQNKIDITFKILCRHRK